MTRIALALSLALACLAPRALAQGTSGLTGSTGTLCLNTGGTLSLALNAGAANAGNVYLVLGTTSGSVPGFSFQGLPVPLNPDAYLDLTLSNANNPALFPSTFGTLDGTGKATAGIVLPLGTKASFVGLQLRYAFLVVAVHPGGLKATFTSNSVGVVLGLPPVAEFSAAPTSGVAPLTVSFTNLTTNQATSFLWEFGDGTTSSATNPTKTYTKSGSFNVKLTATGPCGSNAKTKNGFVQVPRTFTDVYTIFQAGNQCINCHTGAFPGGGLSYDTKALAFAEMINVTAACSASEKIVIPFNAAGSFLVKKIREASFGTPNACGLAMPFLGLPGAALSAASVADIESWITSGAPNN